MTESFPTPPERRIRVLYAAGKRVKWWPLLAASSRFVARQVPVYQPGGNGLAPSASLVQAVRRFRPHLVLTEYSGLRHLPLLALCSGFRLPLVVGVKGDPWAEAADRAHAGRMLGGLARLLNFWASSLILRRADLLLPLTPALARSLRTHLGTQRSCRVVAIPYQEPVTAPSAGPSCELLTVTNFRFRTKIEPLIRTAATLAPLLEKLGLKWRILGDGPFLEPCRQQLRHHPGIRFEGFRDPGPYYLNAKIFLYPSGLDGIPNVVLEAALHELPILVNRGSPAAELISDGETGMLFDLDDPTRSGEQLRELATDAGLRRKLGRAAAAWARETFAPERVASDLEAALLSVLPARGRPPA